MLSMIVQLLLEQEVEQVKLEDLTVKLQVYVKGGCGGMSSCAFWDALFELDADGEVWLDGPGEMEVGDGSVRYVAWPYSPSLVRNG